MLKHTSRHFSYPCFGKDKTCCRLISIVHLETGEKNHPYSHNFYPPSLSWLVLKIYLADSSEILEQKL